MFHGVQEVIGMLFDRFGPRGYLIEDHGPGVFPFLLWVFALVALAALAAWLILSLRRGWQVPATTTGVPATLAAPRSDDAIEQARMRYARGDIGRDEFLQIAMDLGQAGEAVEERPPE